MKVDSSNHWLDESIEIKLRNHEKEPVEIRVVEHLCRWTNWEISEKSDRFTKTKAQTMEFRIPIKSQGRKDDSLHRALFVVIGGLAVGADIV